MTDDKEERKQAREGERTKKESTMEKKAAETASSARSNKMGREGWRREGGREG